MSYRALALLLLSVPFNTGPAFAQKADQPIAASEAAELRAQIAALRAEIDALKADRLMPEPAPASLAVPTSAVTPTWLGAPQFSDEESGWTFKPRGRLHVDVGHVGIPGAYSANRNLGFNASVRRIRLGAEGRMPGGFGYRWEADFANNEVSFSDVFISWSGQNSPLTFRVGNLATLGNLERMSSINNTTVPERNQFDEAFLNNRRIGGTVAYQAKELRLEAGLFAAHSLDNSFDNDGWISAARGVYAPKAFGGQLHFGLNWQHRNFQSNDGGTVSTSASAPSTNQLARYRARPFTRLTDVRFVDTGPFAAKSDAVFGLEAAAIFRGLYVSGEAQLVRTNAYAAGDLAAGLDGFSGGNVAVVPTGDPTFLGLYGEVGYFLTGETRGYKDGAWSRTKVLNPLSTAGGTGAFQIAVRFEHLDLDSDELKSGLTNDFTSGATNLAALSARLGRGGMQTGYLLALNWYPIDHIRVMLNYGRIEVRGGPLAAQIKPLSVLPIDQRSFGTDLFAARFQLEF